MSLIENSLTSRNVSDVVNSLKKEIIKASAPENIGAEGNTEYRRLLIQTLQQACRQYPDFADSIVVVLIDMLRDKTNDQHSASDIITFLREVLSSHAGLRNIVVEKLGELLPELNRSRVARMALWMIGEFGTKEHAQSHVKGILNCLAPLPLTAGGKLTDVDVDKEASTLANGMTSIGADENKATTGVISTRTVVLADGTYASQAVYGSIPKVSMSGKNSSAIRNMISNGDVLLATVTGVVICKLLVRSGIISNMAPQIRNEILFAITCLTKVVKSALSFGGGREQLARLIHCVRVIARPEDEKILASAMREWSSDACRVSLTKLVAAETALRLKANSKKPALTESLPSKGIEYRILKEKRDILVAADPQLLAAELGNNQAEDSSDTIPGVLTSLSGLSKNSASLFSQRLNKAVAMTGLADSVYIEGFLRLHSFDLILELSIVNRTSETLQNILVELCTNGDLKVVEKPHAVTLGPGESATVYSTIRVSSTENGTIFGYATLDRKSALDKEWIVLNEVHADVVDYIVPKSTVMEGSFKNMWQEFEWENKISINTTTERPGDFIETLCKSTNLGFVGSENQVKITRGLTDKSQFVAVNLYAKSIFDEDALVNVSLEREPGGKLTGTVRIRARNQGIALSLGDKVNQIQREQLRKQRGS